MIITIILKIKKKKRLNQLKNKQLNSKKMFHLVNKIKENLQDNNKIKNLFLCNQIKEQQKKEFYLENKNEITKKQDFILHETIIIFFINFLYKTYLFISLNSFNILI